MSPECRLWPAPPRSAGSADKVLPDNTATNIVSAFPRDVNHAVGLNSFFGCAPAINRATGVRGPFVTDPSCLYDEATQRCFVVVLTLDTRPNGTFLLTNHLDIAVSQTSNAAGAWNIYRIDATNDGTNTGGVNPGPSGEQEAFAIQPRCAIDTIIELRGEVAVRIRKPALSTAAC